MHKVGRMSQTPTTCLYCGRGNTPDEPDSMDEFWAIDLERDVNWGDSTYICKYCCDVLAATAGYVTMEQLQEQMNLQQRMKRKIHDLEAKLQERDRRLTQIATGRRAVQQTRKHLTKEEDAKPKKKKVASKQRAA